MDDQIAIFIYSLCAIIRVDEYYVCFFFLSPYPVGDRNFDKIIVRILHIFGVHGIMARYFLRLTQLL